MNENAKGRIKENSTKHSKTFVVEESLKQGGGLSAILYGQHIGAVVENLEKQNMGSRIGTMDVLALAWQDDVTLLPKDEDEETNMIDVFEQSTDKNRVRLAIEKKTKVLTVGKANSLDPTIMKNQIVKETNKAKILGYTFNDKGNVDTHLENRESETIAMMANMGMSINENHMGRIYLFSLLVIYEKCFVPKMLYGLIGIPLQNNNWEKLELIDRKVLRNFLNLPSSTPKVSLYNELGIIPLKYMLWKRKLGMWWRLKREESNYLMKQCLNDQINSNLPWIVELNRIACKLDLDLDEAKYTSKEQWKKYVKEKTLNVVKEERLKEVDNLKGYKKNLKDEIEVGKKKRYVSLSQKKAKVWFRMRADIIDPAPRQPYNPQSIWKCKFCEEEQQDTEHYVRLCKGIETEIFDGMNRNLIYSVIQTLQCDESMFIRITYVLMRIYNMINRD